MRIFWHFDRKWYSARVLRFDAPSGQFLVAYAADDQEHIYLHSYGAEELRSARQRTLSLPEVPSDARVRDLELAARQAITSLVIHDEQGVPITADDGGVQALSMTVAAASVAAIAAPEPSHSLIGHFGSSDEDAGRFLEGVFVQSPLAQTPAAAQAYQHQQQPQQQDKPPNSMEPDYGDFMASDDEEAKLDDGAAAASSAASSAAAVQFSNKKMHRRGSQHHDSKKDNEEEDGATSSYENVEPFPELDMGPSSWSAASIASNGSAIRRLPSRAILKRTRYEDDDQEENYMCFG